MEFIADYMPAVWSELESGLEWPFVRAAAQKISDAASQPDHSRWTLPDHRGRETSTLTSQLTSPAAHLPQPQERWDPRLSRRCTAFSRMTTATSMPARMVW